MNLHGIGLAQIFLSFEVYVCMYIKYIYAVRIAGMRARLRDDFLDKSTAALHSVPHSSSN